MDIVRKQNRPVYEHFRKYNIRKNTTVDGKVLNCVYAVDENPVFGPIYK